MPKASSFSDVVQDWESLLIATEEHAAEMPEAGRHRAALAEHLVLTRQLKTVKAAAVAAKQQATQELQAAVTEGRDLAIRVRGAVRAALGPKSERLMQFGIAPIRARRRSDAEGETTAAPLPGDDVES